MVDKYTVFEGDFGHAELVEYNHNLVTHVHSSMHIGFWLAGGTAHVHVAEKQIPYQINQALGINSFVSHDLCIDDPADPAIFLMLYIDDEWISKRFECMHKPVWLPLVPIQLDQVTQQACWLLMRLLTSPQNTVRELTDQAAGQLITHTVELALQMTSSHHHFRRPKMVDYRLRVAMAYMRDNLSNPTLALAVADVVGLSRSRLYELFHDEMGTSPMVYWNSVRIEEAAKRLSTEDDNLTAMALDLGFSSPGNFSRFFRDHMGTTPSKYRRKCHAI